MAYAEMVFRTGQFEATFDLCLLKTPSALETVLFGPGLDNSSACTRPPFFSFIQHGAFSHRTSTTNTAFALTCPFVRTALSPGRSRAPKQARSSPFHRLADSTIVTSDWPPERRPPHHRGQQPHCSAGAFRPCGWQAQVYTFDCCMAVSGGDKLCHSGDRIFWSRRFDPRDQRPD